MRISNMQLVKIGAVGGLITVTMGLALRIKLNNQIKATDYYKEALSILRSNPGAVHLLGEPIKDNSIEVGDDKHNYTTDDEARYEVPVKGPKDRGTLYFWAKRLDDRWTVNRMELGLKSEPDRRLLIKADDN